MIILLYLLLSLSSISEEVGFNNQITKEYVMLESNDIDYFIDHSTDARLISYLQEFRTKSVPYRNIIIQIKDDTTLELVVSSQSTNAGWTGGVVQYYLNAVTGALEMGWHEHPMPIHQTDHDELIRLEPELNQITLYIHSGGFRVFGGAAVPVAKISYTVEINGRNVFKSTVTPPSNSDNPERIRHRKKMAEYQEVRLEAAPVYDIVVRDDERLYESTKELKTTKSVWVHINAEVKPSPEGLSDNTSIAIDINDRPQSYR